jgi:hypothetical protein
MRCCRNIGLGTHVMAPLGTRLSTCTSGFSLACTPPTPQLNDITWNHGPIPDIVSQ